MSAQAFEAVLVQGLRDLVIDVNPDPGLGDRVLARAAGRRRRYTSASLSGVLLAAVGAATALVLAGGSAARPELKLASFRLRLPARAHVTPLGSHVCLPAMVMYPSTQVPSGGPANPTEPRVASGVTAAGGCVSVLLTAPFTPGSNQVPTPFMDEQSAEPVQVGAYAGTLGPATWTGGSMTYDGYSIPDGTVQSVLSLRVPAGGGQVEDLVFAAEKISAPQLLSIVRAGLRSDSSATSAG
jgi:hypothetical protein